MVIAARNAADHLAETLESIAEQDRPADEVVLFDDGSTDATRSIAEGFRDRLPALTVLGVENSVGISAARNRAGAAVSSDYIAVLDADDLLVPGALSGYAEFLRENPDTDLAYGDCSVFTGDPDRGVAMRYAPVTDPRKAMRRVLSAPILPLKHSSVLMRRSALEELGGYDESFPIKVDVELFLRFLDRGRSVRKLDRIISRHRKHGRQVSTRRIAGLRAYRRLFRLYERNPVRRAAGFPLRAAAEIAKGIVRG